MLFVVFCCCLLLSVAVFGVVVVWWCSCLCLFLVVVSCVPFGAVILLLCVAVFVDVFVLFVAGVVCSRCCRLLLMSMIVLRVL